MRNVAHVACVSEQTQRDVIEFVGVDPDRTSVIPNGVSTGFMPFDHSTRARLRATIAGPGTRIVLHVSTGAAYKNVEGSLRTLAALRAMGTPAVLVRAGAVLRPSQLSLARRLGIAAAVHDLGRVSDRRLGELYNLADVLLFPSHYEGFGWPPLEAMASGTPVVTSEAPALLEVTDDAALHAPAANPSELALAIRSIFDDPAVAQRLVNAGIKRAAHYRWAKTARAFDALYRRVLGEGRPTTVADSPGRRVGRPLTGE
jgi:glycosyltransferase involved in cell wall biosynthesis